MINSKICLLRAQKKYNIKSTFKLVPLKVIVQDLLVKHIEMRSVEIVMLFFTQYLPSLQGTHICPCVPFTTHFPLTVSEQFSSHMEQRVYVHGRVCAAQASVCMQACVCV